MIIGKLPIGLRPIGAGPKEPIVGIASSTLNTVVQNATGITGLVYSVSGTATFALPELSQNATGTKSPDAITSSVGSVLPSLTQNATGAVSIDNITGIGTSTLPILVQNSSGAKSSDAITGTATSVLPGLQVVATGAKLPDAISGSITSVLPQLTQNGTAFYDDSPQSVFGPATSILPTLRQNASGAKLQDVITGVATSILGPLSQVSAGKAVTPHFGPLTSILPQLRGTIYVDVIKGDLYDVCGYPNRNFIGAVNIDVTGFVINRVSLATIDRIETAQTVNKDTQVEIEKCQP